MTTSPEKNSLYVKLLKWFADFPGLPHVYSIHHMVQCGMKYDKLPGEWYGPSTAAHVLRDIAAVHYIRYEGEIQVYVTNSDTIYTSEVNKLCTGSAVGSTTALPALSTAIEQGEESGTGNSSVSNVRNLLSSVHGILTHNPHPTVAALSDPIVTHSPIDDPTEFFDPLLRPPPGMCVEQPWNSSCLIIIPLKLGVDTVNPVYIQV